MTAANTIETGYPNGYPLYLTRLSERPIPRNSVSLHNFRMSRKDLEGKRIAGILAEVEGPGEGNTTAYFIGTRTILDVKGERGHLKFSLVEETQQQLPDPFIPMGSRIELIYGHDLTRGW